MIKVTLKIKGMACGMCEAHMNDVVRKTCPQAKKVSSSFKKGETVFISENSVPENELRSAIAETGYELIDIHTEPYQKKRFLFF